MLNATRNLRRLLLPAVVLVLPTGCEFQRPTLSAMSTGPDSGTLTATLEHFSRYGLTFPD